MRGEGITIVLVEDNPGDVELFSEAIAEIDESIDVHVSTTGECALSLLRGDGQRAIATVDLVVLDLDLPGKSGLTVLREFRNADVAPETPIVIRSSIDDEATIREALELGADGFVVKGTDFDEAVANARALVDRWLPVAGPPEGDQRSP